MAPPQRPGLSEEEEKRLVAHIELASAEQLISAIQTTKRFRDIHWNDIAALEKAAGVEMGSDDEDDEMPAASGYGDDDERAVPRPGARKRKSQARPVDPATGAPNKRKSRVGNGDNKQYRYTEAQRRYVLQILEVNKDVVPTPAPKEMNAEIKKFLASQGVHKGDQACNSLRSRVIKDQDKTAKMLKKIDGRWLTKEHKAELSRPVTGGNVDDSSKVEDTDEDSGDGEDFDEDQD